MPLPRAYREMRIRVLAHYKKYGRRTLPWRKKQTPYRVCISEYMLQQTGVDRVIPKFNAFIQEFPTFKKLAQAPLPPVLWVWQGLGYNRRAKYLRDAAQRIVQEKKGIVPNDTEYLESLPGIGPYTARAIQTFAFGNAEPFVETNIRTAVIHHCFPRKKVVHDKDILGVLERLTPKRGAAARLWYAALMDYGAYLKRDGHRLNVKSAHYTKQKPFKGSRRELRGALVRALLVAGASEASLTRVLGRGTKEIHEELLRLQKEGLVTEGRDHRWELTH